MWRGEGFHYGQLEFEVLALWGPSSHGEPDLDWWVSGGNQARDKGKLALGWEGGSEGHYHLIRDRGFAQCTCWLRLSWFVKTVSWVGEEPSGIMRTGIGFLDEEVIWLNKMFQWFSCRNKSVHLQWRKVSASVSWLLSERRRLHSREGINLSC